MDRCVSWRSSPWLAGCIPPLGDEEVLAMRPPDDDPRVLAASILCRVEDIGDGRVDVQLGHVVFRLSRRELASLAGTLQRVVRQVSPHRRAMMDDLPHLRLVRGVDEEAP